MNRLLVFGLLFAISCGSSNGGDKSALDGGTRNAVPGTGLGPRNDFDGAIISEEDGGSLPLLCPSVAVCGGNLVGAWKFTTACAAMSDIQNCDRFAYVPMTGSIAFGADGTFAISVSSYSVVIKTSDACVVSSGRECTGNICAEGNDGYCDCTLFSNLADYTSGTYAASGNALVFPSSPIDAGNGSFLFDAESFEYCVSGNSLTLVAKAKTNSYGVSKTVIAAVRN